MENHEFDLNMLEDDRKTIENVKKIALGNNFSSIMLSRADAGGYPIVYVNPAFTELTGYAHDEVIGKEPSLLQGPKTDRKLLEQLRTTLDNGDVFTGKTVNYHKDGSEFMMEWKVFPVNNSKNQTTHFLAIQRAA